MGNKTIRRLKAYIFRFFNQKFPANRILVNTTIMELKTLLNTRDT